jgi:hypothetical protein
MIDLMLDVAIDLTESGVPMISIAKKMDAVGEGVVLGCYCAQGDRMEGTSAGACRASPSRTTPLFF